MFTLQASCHCKNIHAALQLSREPKSYSPRACDCEFCRKHGASYLSDPAGSLQVEVVDEDLVGKYRQGSENAEFVFCKNCGVLVAVTYQENEKIFAAINSGCVDGDIAFGEKVSVSPQQLSAADKVKRWQEVWFSEVGFRLG